MRGIREEFRLASMRWYVWNFLAAVIILSSTGGAIMEVRWVRNPTVVTEGTPTPET